MSDRFRTILCWMMTVSVAIAAVGAVMSPPAAHRERIAAGLAFMVLLNGYIWWMLHKVPSLKHESARSKP